MTEPTSGPAAVRVPVLGRLHAIGAADYATAVTDLEATHAQAVVLVANAFAWRLCVVLLPIALVAAVGSLIAGFGVFSAALWPGLAILGPQVPPL